MTMFARLKDAANLLSIRRRIDRLDAGQSVTTTPPMAYAFRSHRLSQLRRSAREGRREAVHWRHEDPADGRDQEHEGRA